MYHYFLLLRRVDGNVLEVFRVRVIGIPPNTSRDYFSLIRGLPQLFFWDCMLFSYYMPENVLFDLSHDLSIESCGSICEARNILQYISGYGRYVTTVW